MRSIIATAARAGRQDAWRILAVAITVSIFTALVEVIVVNFIDDATNVPLSLIAELSSAGIGLLGTVFLSGFLSRLVGHARQGRARVTILQVARGLPWLRLVLADALVVLLVVLGLLALVIPGLILLNLLAVTGPVIEIEDRGVLGALRRSAHLVRRHFWTVALLATVPVAVASEIETIEPEPSGAGAIVEVLAIRGVIEAIVEAAIGLVIVELCYRLIEADARRSAAAGDVAAG